MKTGEQTKIRSDDGKFFDSKFSLHTKYLCEKWKVNKILEKWNQ